MKIRWVKDVVVRCDGVVLGKDIEADVPDTEYWQNAFAERVPKERIAKGYAVTTDIRSETTNGGKDGTK